MSLPVPIPAPAAQHPQATIVWPRNPFHPADKDLYPVQPGSTVADWMQAQSITEFPLPTVCLVNGQPLLRRYWAIRPLTTHDVVVLVGLPGGGGGGGGSNPLRVVLSIAVMVLAPYAAAGLMGYGMTAAGIAAAQAAMGTIGFGLLAAGVSVLGAYLVNALVPLPSANVPSAQNALAPSPTYSLQSQGNFARLLQPIPVIYGRHLVYPDLGATPYTEYVNNEQYLHQLLVIGQGDYEIEAVRIEDTPIQSFEEVQAQVILPGGKNTLFNHDVVTAPEVAGQELLAIDDPANTRGEAIGPFIVNPPETWIDTLGIDILLPRGLFYANDSGGQDAKEVRWTVEARAVNDEGEPTTGWQTLISGTSYSAWSGWNTTWSTASAVTTQTYHYDSEGGYYSTSYGPPPMQANTLNEEYQLGDCASQDYESGICYSYYIQRRTRSAYSQQEVISAATPDTIRRSYRYPVTPGRYEVKVVRLDHKDTRTRAGHELRWGEVRGYLVNPSLPAGITFLAVKMRATDNLSMRSSRLINCLVTRKLPVWNPSTGWSSPLATRSIAWAFADAVRATYGAKLADSRIDLPALYRLEQTWAARGDQFDAVFDQKVTVWEALTRIARCGRAVPYTYNHRINRLSTVQEHYMIRRAIDRGVSKERLARAFNVNLSSINRRINLLEGICPEAITLLQDKQFTPDVTRILRNMKAARQVEAVELMIASNTITVAHAEALLKATPPEQRTDVKAAEREKKTAPIEQIEKLEKEMSQVQEKYHEAESSYGSDLLNLVVAKGYLTKLLANGAVKSYIGRHEPEILTHLELVVNTVSMEEAVQQKQEAEA